MLNIRNRALEACACMLEGTAYTMLDTARRLRGERNDWKKIKRAYTHQGKISAIKLHRELFESRLIDAKTEVEQRADELNWTRP